MLTEDCDCRLPTRMEPWQRQDGGQQRRARQVEPIEETQRAAEPGAGHFGLLVALRAECSVQTGQALHSQTQCLLLANQVILSR